MLEDGTHRHSVHNYIRMKSTHAFIYQNLTVDTISSFFDCQDVNVIHKTASNSEHQGTIHM